MNEETVANILKQQNKDAILSIYAGNYEDAIKYFLNSIALEDKFDLGVHRARSRVNLANTYYLLHEYEKAVGLLDEAKTIFEKENRSEELYECLLLKCHILFFDDKLSEAENILKNIREKCRYDLISAKAGVILYKIFSKNDRRDALDILNKSIVFFERTGDVLNLQEALKLRIAHYEKHGRTNLAAVDMSHLNSIE